jgi:hypothetical protein
MGVSRSAHFNQRLRGIMQSTPRLFDGGDWRVQVSGSSSFRSYS